MAEEQRKPFRISDDKKEGADDKAEKLRLAALRRQIQMEELYARKHLQEDLRKQYVKEEEDRLKQRLEELRQRRHDTLKKTDTHNCSSNDPPNDLGNEKLFDSPGTSAVLVSCLNPETADDCIKAFFENRKQNFGGPVKMIERLSNTSALLHFEFKQVFQEFCPENTTMAVEQPQHFRISDDKNENEDDKAQHFRVAVLRRQIQMEELIRKKLRQQFAMEEEQSLKERLKELRQQRLDSLKKLNTQKSSPGGFQNDHDEDEEDKARKVRLAALRRQVQMEEVNARQQRQKELGKQAAIEEERKLEEKLRELKQQRLGALHTARGSSCRHSLITPDSLPFLNPAAVTSPSFVSNQAYNDLLQWDCDFCMVTNMRFSSKCFGCDAERPHTRSTGQRSESMTGTDTEQATATSLRLDHPSNEGNTGFIPPSLDKNGNPFSISRDQNHDRQQKYETEYIAVTNLFKNLFLERREVPGVFVFGQQTSAPALFSFQHTLTRTKPVGEENPITKTEQQP